MAKNLTPIDKMIYDVCKCVKCGAKIGQCDCWTKCSDPDCTWMFEKDSKCRNPKHNKSK